MYDFFLTFLFVFTVLLCANYLTKFIVEQKYRKFQNKTKAHKEESDDPNAAIVEYAANYRRIMLTPIQFNYNLYVDICKNLDVCFSYVNTLYELRQLMLQNAEIRPSVLNSKDDNYVSYKNIEIKYETTKHMLRNHYIFLNRIVSSIDLSTIPSDEYKYFVESLKYIEIALQGDIQEEY